MSAKKAAGPPFDAAIAALGEEAFVKQLRVCGKWLQSHPQQSVAAPREFLARTVREAPVDLGLIVVLSVADKCRPYPRPSRHPIA
jgi:hypothetical protein